MVKNTSGVGCCICCFTSILSLGLTALVMWLSLRISNPVCSIQDFYIPYLNVTDNHVDNRTIYVDLRIQYYGMNDVRVYYGNINLTFFYNSTLPVANYTVPAFYQGRKKKSRRKMEVQTVGMPWAAALDAVVNGSTVGFRVWLATRVKLKILFWYTKPHSLVVGGEVKVDGSGRKVRKKGITLKSGAADRRSWWLVRMALVSLMILFF